MFYSKDYLRDSNDPLIRGVWNPDHRWFLVSVASELIFQVPCFLAAIVGLYNSEYSKPELISKFKRSVKCNVKNDLTLLTLLCSRHSLPLIPLLIRPSNLTFADNRKVYPILIAYSTLASITTIQCLASVLFGPEIKNLTSSNLVALLSGYVPFAVVPIIMMVDMTIRTTNLIGQVEEKEKDRKRR